MNYDHNTHNRHSIRLKGYDYSKPGVYFINLCIQNRECLMGDVLDGNICINDAGKMIKKWWQILPQKFTHIQLDEYIIMPNHIHGIIIIQNSDTTTVGADQCVCPSQADQCVCPSQADQCVCPSQADQCVCPDNNKGEHAGSPLQTDSQKGKHIGLKMGGHTGPPLPTIVQWFKTMTTNEYIRNVKTNRWPPFNKKFWQRNYYEHIIRDESELNRIRKYVIENPLKWEDDEYHPIYYLNKKNKSL